MQSNAYVEASITDLEDSLIRIKAVNQHFPQYRVPIRGINHSIKQLTNLLEKRNANRS